MNDDGGGVGLTGAPERAGAVMSIPDPKRKSDCKEKGVGTRTVGPAVIGARTQSARRSPT
jgi:hypothetical protein